LNRFLKKRWNHPWIPTRSPEWPQRFDWDNFEDIAIALDRTNFPDVDPYTVRFTEHAISGSANCPDFPATPAKSNEGKNWKRFRPAWHEEMGRSHESRRVRSTVDKFCEDIRR